MSYKVQNRQSVFDIAIAATGSVESVVEIARLNNFGLNNRLEFGTVLQIPFVINQNVVNYLNNKNITPVSLLKSDKIMGLVDNNNNNVSDNNNNIL